MMINRNLVYFYAILLYAFISLQCNNNKTTKDENINLAKDELGLGLKLASDAAYLKVDAAALPSGAGDLPALVDNSINMPPVGHQGRQQSCVAWATAYALKSFEEKKESNTTLLFSPSFVYNQINNGVDGGSFFEDALNILSQQGTSLLTDMPYDENDYLKKPSDMVKEKAKPYRILHWRRINVQDSREVKMHVNRKFPVIFGAKIDENFRAGKKGGSTNEFIWNTNTQGGLELGYHAMVVVGYDDSKNAFKVMNSWGKDWANDGYCWIDYQLFEKRVPQGYIVFDQPTNPDNSVVDNKPNDKPVIDNNAIVINDPTQFAKANLKNIQVQHNVMDNTYGYCMKISGYIDIPAGFGRTFQISNHFYLSNSTLQAKSLMNPTFADVNGFAATGSILYPVPEKGLNNYYWECLMPYKALDLPYEITYFYFVPTLFIDNFGYAKGEAVNFYVNKKFLN